MSNLSNNGIHYLLDRIIIDDRFVSRIFSTNDGPDCLRAELIDSNDSKEVITVTIYGDEVNTTFFTVQKHLLPSVIRTFYSHCEGVAERLIAQYVVAFASDDNSRPFEGTASLLASISRQDEIGMMLAREYAEKLTTEIFEVTVDDIIWASGEARNILTRRFNRIIDGYE